MTGGVGIQHAGLVAQRRKGQWQGLLLRGASGVGKSDLALRLVAAGWRLVADDRTLVWRDADQLFGRAPAVLAGKVELRGQGVLAGLPVLSFAQITLIVDCRGPGQPLERLPEPVFERLLDVTIPRVAIVAAEASAPARLDQLLSQPHPDV